jgi:hypothetical protein
MIVLRDAIPQSVMNPTSIATENVLSVSKMAATLPMRESGILTRICSTIGTDLNLIDDASQIPALHIGGDDDTPLHVLMIDEIAQCPERHDVKMIHQALLADLIQHKCRTLTITAF